MVGTSWLELSVGVLAVVTGGYLSIICLGECFDIAS